MARRFQVGDRVRILRGVQFRGCLGTIVELFTDIVAGRGASVRIDGAGAVVSFLRADLRRL